MKKVLIVGAGDAGQKVLQEIKKHPKIGLRPIGFIDDDLKKQRQRFGGLLVLGTRKKLLKIIKGNKPDEVIIALPSVEGEIIADIIQKLIRVGVKYKIVPRVREIIEGKVNINRIRDVQPEDLLGRPVVKTDIPEIAKFLKGKRIFVSGGAGSIGAEIVRQAGAYQAGEVVVLDWWENGLFELGLEMENSFPKIKFFPVIGNIQDQDKVKWVVNHYQPQIIFHAAAFKHVPLMEENPTEAIKNNVFGTQNVALAAKESRVERFVLISTDKAANPKSVMGASKLIAESIVYQLGEKSKTKFMVVRFGNVLDSYGSILPLFKKQILNGGPVTVTHPKMTRYFMTIPEATHLVLKAAAAGENQQLFILKMGEPIKILDFVKNLIQLSGLMPGKDIKIKFIGKRPGEKMSERLLTKEEEKAAIDKGRFWQIPLKGIDSQKLKSSLRRFKTLCQKEDNLGILKEFHYLFPCFPKK